MQKALGVKDYAVNIRRIIHQNPELAFKEYDTTALIKKELMSMGVEIMPLEIETGVVGLIHGVGQGRDRVTALRADIDALPIIEGTGKSYTSRNHGVMHACGHDGHTAILLAVAKVLATIREKFSGTVKLIFQPAEEVLGGAKKIIAAGAMDNPKADSIVALHCSPEYYIGQVGIATGGIMASSDKFVVTMKGKGAHASTPFQGINPVLGVSMAITALQNIVGQEINTIEQAVVQTCTIEGGTAFNIIPEKASFSGTIRCLNSSVRDKIEESFKRIVNSAAAMTNCRCEIEYLPGVPVLKNTAMSAGAIAHAAKQVLGKDNVLELAPVLGSEDFSFLIAHVGEGALFRVGIAEPGKEMIALHNRMFDFNDDALPYSVAVLLQYVLNVNNGS